MDRASGALVTGYKPFLTTTCWFVLHVCHVAITIFNTSCAEIARSCIIRSIIAFVAIIVTTTGLENDREGPTCGLSWLLAILPLASPSY